MKSGKNNAKRRYTRGVIVVMTAYVGLVFSSSASVHRWHPAGWHLYLAAALPTIPIIGLSFIVARYLREEKDEYLRDMTVLCLLWGTAVALGISVFDGFLRSYGSTLKIPVFSEFIAFWLTMACVRVILALRNRESEDE